MLSTRFYSATRDYTTLEHHVPAPYMRRSFVVDAPVASAKLCVCGLGFYRVFLNGRELTKGRLAPYVSNPDHYLYYDEYDLGDALSEGKSVLGFLLGNGFLNAVGGFIWNFDKAPWRSAPKVAFALEITYADGRSVCLQADEQLLCHPSPIRMDDERMGEWYDARAEIDDWCSPLLDDTDWTPALAAELPRGERRVVDCEPIVCTREIKPVRIYKGGIGAWPRPRPDMPTIEPEGVEAETQGFVYDFGTNGAGVLRLHIRARAGQKIVLQFGEECMRDGSGDLDLSGINFLPHRYNYRCVYTCREGEQIWTPSFCFFGFRYCLVLGLKEEQATEELLTYEIMSSALEQIGHFRCSDETVNRINDCTYMSDLSNFFYFPMDCPQREKNGWTGDAALSAEHHMLNWRVERSLREWLRNVRAAQREDGCLPGIVPTDTWGYHAANLDFGPAWDGVVFQIPYYAYQYRGDLTMAREMKDCMLRQLHLMRDHRTDKGLIDYGLGDWCHTGRENQNGPACPRCVSSTIVALDLCAKAAVLYDALGEPTAASLARSLQTELRAAFREHLIDFAHMTVQGDCQTAQAMALYYGLFDASEHRAALDVLLAQIERADNRMDLGVLGARVLFHLLSQNGHSDLAYQMITTREFPSYAYWVHTWDATTLFEDFMRPGEKLTSHNHHFWGDVSSWFTRELAGLKINPRVCDASEIEISPALLDELTYAQADHLLPVGRVAVRWHRDGEDIVLALELPEQAHGTIRLPLGWQFTTGETERAAATGEWRLRRSQK